MIPLSTRSHRLNLSNVLPPTSSCKDIHWQNAVTITKLSKLDGFLLATQSLTEDIHVDEGEDSDDEPASAVDVDCKAPADVENGIPVPPTSLSAELLRYL
jgi:hypothetical protein